MSPQVTPRSSRPRAAVDTNTHPKTALHCPCGRTAAHDQWPARPTPAGRALVCPDCDTVLTVR